MVETIFLNFLEHHRPQQHKRVQAIALVEAVRVLPSSEGQQLARMAIDLLGINKDAAEDILLKCACLVPGSLTGLHKHLIESKCFYPPELYHGADASSRSLLLERISWDGENRNHLLSAVSWIGDATVQAQFHAWHQQPPSWREQLFVPPESYSVEAGWELTQSGGRRDLFYHTCYTLVQKGKEPASPPCDPVTVIMAHQETCRWCNWEMTTLFDFDLTASELSFLNVSGTRLRVATCDRCSAFAPLFTDVDMDGKSTWSEGNNRPEFLGHDRVDYGRLPENRMMLGPPRRSPYEANQFVLECGQSQVGGHPAWVQDAEYPRCLGCGSLMTFIAQLETADVQQYSEGVTYAFLCSDCGKATTVYQQT